MADLYYYEEGYIDIGYHVYIADAEIYISPYFEDGYIDAGYYLDYSAIGSLTCDAEIVTGVTVEASGTWTSAISLTAVVGKLQFAQADCGSLFSPSVTAEAFKNHTAIIESTTTFTVDAQANRSANVLLEHIANLNAQAAKTAVIDSTMATQATLSAQANHSVVSSATLTSTATFSCLAFNVQFGTAQFVSNASIFTSKYFGTSRPRVGTIGSGAYYDGTTYKFGTHSLAKNSAGLMYESNPYNDYQLLANERFSFGFWYYGPSSASNSVVAGVGNLSSTTLSSEDMWAITHFPGSGFRFTWNVNGVILALNNFIADITNEWYHISVSRIDGFITLTGYRPSNNQTFTSSSSSGQTAAWRQPTTFDNRRLKLFAKGSTTTRFDEVSYLMGSDIGYPSSALNVNDPTNQIILLHFDNNALDDTSETLIGASTLSASASLSAQANGNTKSASASLTSTASITVTGTRIKQFASAVAGVFTVPDVKAKHQANGIASLEQAIFTQTTQGLRIRTTASDQNALFTPSVTVQAQLAGVALLETQFTQTVSAVKTTDVTATITSTATVTAVSTVTAGLAADLASTATVIATGTRTQPATADLASESTLACEFTAFNNVSAAFTSEVTLTADVERYRLASSTLSTAVTLSADVERFRSTSSTVSATATVAATVIRIQSAESALSSVVTQSTVAVKTPGIGVNITGTATITATPIYTAEATVTVGALFTPAIDVDAQFAGVALLESVSTVTALIGVIKQFSITGSALGLAVTLTDPYIGSLTNQGFFGFSARKNQFTASIWARRNTVTGSPQPLWSSDGGGGLILDNDDVILRFNYDPDEPNAAWINLAPTDSAWHHYLIRVETKYDNDQGNSNQGSANTWQLWIDGVYQGLSSPYFAAGQIEFSNGGRALIGNGTIANLTAGYDLVSRRLNGDILQLWMGLTTDNQFNPGLFYDGGYQDLGSTGTLGGLLPTPKIYHRLESPFTGITNAQGSGSLALNYDTVVARATTLITANAVSLAVINPTVVTTLTAAITYQVNPTIAVASASTISCQITQFTGIIANVTSTATLSCDETKINGGNAALTMAADIQAVAGFFENFTSNLASTAILDCDFDNIPPTRGEAALTAQFTVSVDAQSFTDSITMMMSAGTITCDATLIPPIRAQADLVTTATLTAVIGSIEQFAALVMSAGTIAVTAQKTTGIILTVSVTSTLACEIKHYKGIILNLPAFNTQLTVGSIINIDPYLTLTIAPETRLYYVLPENRVRIVESETRVNIV